MDDIFKLDKKHNTKINLLIKSINNINLKANNHLLKSDKIIENFLIKIFAKILQEKYIIKFTGSSIYFYPVEKIKEDFILKVELIKEESSLTPKDFTSYIIVLNSDRYKDINLLLDIEKIIVKLSKNLIKILLKINTTFNIHKNYIKTNLNPKYLKLKSKIINEEKSFNTQLLKILLKSPLLIPQSPPPPNIIIEGISISNVSKIQFTSSKNNTLDILFTTTNKKDNIPQTYEIKSYPNTNIPDLWPQFLPLLLKHYYTS